MEQHTRGRAHAEKAGEALRGASGDRVLKGLRGMVSQINRSVIADALPGLNQALIQDFAVVVARLRAAYLQTAFRIVDKEKGGLPTDDDIGRLHKQRVEYEEMLAAFDALMRAVERRYVDVAE